MLLRLQMIVKCLAICTLFVIANIMATPESAADVALSRIIAAANKLAGNGKFEIAEQQLKAAISRETEVNTKRKLQFALAKDDQLWAKQLVEQSDYSKALIVASEGQVLATAVGDRPDEALALSQLGTALLLTGDTDKATSVLQDAQDVAASSGDADARCRSLLCITTLFTLTGRQEKAKSSILAASKMAPITDNSEDIGASFAAMGVLADESRKPGAALRYELKALAIAKSSKLVYLESESDVGLCCFEAKLGKYNESLASGEQAYSLAAANGFKGVEEESLDTEALTYLYLGQSKPAINVCRTSVALAQGAGDTVETARSLYVLGNAEERTSDFGAALHSFQQAALFANEAGNASELDKFLLAEGNVEMYQHNYDGALRSLEQSLATATPIADLEVEEDDLTVMSYMCRRTQRYQDALSYAQKGLSVTRILGDKRGQEIDFMYVGISLEYLRRYKDSENAFQQSLTEATNVGDAKDERYDLTALIPICRFLRQRDFATLYQKQLAALKSGSQRPGSGADNDSKIVG
jgi:tetratricopeptide (TPR) repeat protein